MVKFKKEGGELRKVGEISRSYREEGCDAAAEMDL